MPPSTFADFIKSLMEEKEQEDKKRAIEKERKAAAKQMLLQLQKQKEAQEKKEKEQFAESILNMELPLDFSNVFSNDEEVKDIKVSSPADGLITCLANRGEVDIEYISMISGFTMAEVIKALKGSIYQNPITWEKCFYKGWETKEKYLSGNLNSKLQLAIKANENFPRVFEDNIKVILGLLKNRKMIPSEDIFVTLGSPWIPEKYIIDFINNCLVPSYGYIWGMGLVHDVKSGTWSFYNKPTQYACYRNLALSSTYGTKRMDAISIIENTLNQTSIVVYDHKKTWKDGICKTTPVKNANETLLALEKQELIQYAFRKWIFESKTRKEKLTELYNNTYCMNFIREYDGSFLTFPGLNPKVKLFDYQKNAVARIILGDNTLLAHDVGSGKTYEMVAGAHEMKRMGLSKKNLIVVPNDIVGQWEKIYRHMYPEAKLLVVYSKDFVPAKRQDTLIKMRDGDYESIIMPYSSFDMIPLSPEFEEEQYNEMVKEIDEAYGNDATATATIRSRYKYVHNEKHKPDFGFHDPDVVYFDDLGIDRFFLDECHNYKNVPIQTNITALGLNVTGSKKCQNMKNKVAYVQKHHNGKGVIFASGTPITNSLSDLYNIQRYLQEGELELLNLKSFNSWIANFAEKKERPEIDVTTSAYRVVARYATFQNLPELAGLLSNIADFHHMDKADNLPDFKGYTDVMVEPSKEFMRFLNDISDRADDVRNRRPRKLRDKGPEDEHDVMDNMLTITTDGRKGALDLRLVNEKYSFDENGKVATCAKKVASIYKDTASFNGTQLIFCDTSTPKQEFNIYDELKRILVEEGVNPDEIKFIHEANSKNKRDSLFSSAQKGTVRVIIGSTFKLATGVNVQNKLIAIHHIDVPWRPADMVQREGRIIRQGNTNKEVFIYRYIVRRSFDAYSWQILENKQVFISSILNNQIVDRGASDLEDSVLTYAEVKALAIGNEEIKKRAEIANELARQSILNKKDMERRNSLRSDIEAIEDNKERWTSDIALIEKDVSFIKSGGAKEPSFLDAERKKAFRDNLFASIRKHSSSDKEVELTTYRGFKLLVPANLYSMGEDNQFVYLLGSYKHRVNIGNSNIGYITRINNYIDNEIEKLLKNKKKNYDDNLAYMASSKLELEKDNPYVKRITELSKELAEIDTKLGLKPKK